MAERIHVLFLIDILYGLAGAEGALLRATKMLPADRYRCSVATFRGRTEMTSLFECPVHIFPLERVIGLRSIACALELRRFIRNEKVDVVHTFFQASDLWGGIVSRLSRKVILISSRRDMGFMRSPKQSLCYRLLAPIYDQVQTVSEQVRHYTIKADHIDASKVVTIPNGIDTDPVAPSRERIRAALNISPDAKVVISVGHIRHVKGTDIVVEAAKLVCAREPDVIFIIAGTANEPEFFRQVKDRVHESGLADRVLFLGRRNDIRELLSASDVFCLLSRSEGMSNALLEAMAESLPCVVSAAGGNNEVIETERTGLIVPVEDAEAAAKAILFCLRQPERRKALGEAACSDVRERFSAEAMVRRMASSYEQLTTAHLTRRTVKIGAAENDRALDTVD